jgi:hypothetical protein
MAIKTIALSRLEKDVKATLNECADSGETMVVQLPDHRLIAMQVLEAAEDDSVVDELIESNPDFRALIEKSKRSGRKPFVPRAKG